ncbi:MAG TPA: glycosidase [Bacteroidales bacterium]|nr:glycosidase [Bacteroidales bacterium]
MTNNQNFNIRLAALRKNQELLTGKKNTPVPQDHGLYLRYADPVILPGHIPLEWRFDLNPETNPLLLERIGVNAVFNAGAMKFRGKYCLAVRVEGWDRKSYFAIAESETGIDGFRFRQRPITLPPNDPPEVNVYDMRLVAHEDGYIYGVYCAERKDPDAPRGDTSQAIAAAAIVRSKDLDNWERLPDLITKASQQRNVVLHPVFVDGRYCLYTRPQSGFIEVGSGGGIGLGFVRDMTNPVVTDERFIQPRRYHTIYELKNGLGPSPILTKEGWLHLAHGVRNTAAGLRYTLYVFMTAGDDISRVIYQPAGYFMAPQGAERIGDVSNVLFSCGWIPDDDGRLLIYYASSDTRLHVASTTLEQMVDYVKNTPGDGGFSSASVMNINNLIDQNLSL